MTATIKANSDFRREQLYDVEQKLLPNTKAVENLPVVQEVDDSSEDIESESEREPDERTGYFRKYDGKKKKKRKSKSESKIDYTKKWLEGVEPGEVPIGAEGGDSDDEFSPLTLETIGRLKMDKNNLNEGDLKKLTSSLSGKIKAFSVRRRDTEDTIKRKKVMRDIVDRDIEKFTIMKKELPKPPLDIGTKPKDSNDCEEPKTTKGIASLSFVNEGDDTMDVPGLVKDNIPEEYDVIGDLIEGLDTKEPYNDKQDIDLGAYGVNGSKIEKRIEELEKEEGVKKKKKKEGKGVQVNRNAYKIDPQGMYASTSLMIDPYKLMNNFEVNAYMGGSLVYNTRANKSTIDLLTKHFNSKKPYTKRAIKIFNDLNMLSMPKSHPSSLKSKLGGNIHFSSHNQMMERLKILTASRLAGNSSVAIRNEIWNLIDRLRKDDKISSDQYNAYVKKHRIV